MFQLVAKRIEEYNILEKNECTFCSYSYFLLMVLTGIVVCTIFVGGLVPAHFAISQGTRPRSCIVHMVSCGSQLGSSLLCIKRSAFFLVNTRVIVRQKE